MIRLQLVFPFFSVMRYVEVQAHNSKGYCSHLTAALMSFNLAHAVSSLPNRFIVCGENEDVINVPVTLSNQTLLSNLKASDPRS